MSISRALLTAAALTFLPVTAQPAAAHAAACRTKVPSDFNGDGFSDLAVAAPYDTVNGKARAGTVAVFHGSADGLTKVATLAQGAQGIPGEPEVGDSFGSALAAGDFDGDGCADLAVGVSEEFSGRSRQGAGGHGIVHVLYGSPRGFGRVRTLDVRDLGRRYGTDRFGAALAAGDLDGDGDDDLAIGVPGEDVTISQRGMDYGDGAVNVLYGSRRGLTAARNELWTQEVGGIKGKARYYDRFGSALATGDLNGDGDDELIIGVPGESAVQILAGTRSGGLTRNHNILIPGPRLSGFGASVATGAFTGRRPHDLVVAAPAAGRLTFYPGTAGEGSSTGIRPSRASVITRHPKTALVGYTMAP